MVQWLSDVKGKHFHASSMLFTLGTDASVFDQSEMTALLLQSSELLIKAKEASGWAETKERLDLEFALNEKLSVFLPLGSPVRGQCLQRNVEIARHQLFAHDPEKQAGSLAGPTMLKLGWTPANPSPSPKDLREGCQLIGELGSAYHQVAALCAEQGGGGTKEQASERSCPDRFVSSVS